MIKKITALMLVLCISVLMGACTIKNNNNNGEKATRTTTEQVTLIRNSFKEVLPKAKFENDIKETYIDGMNYKFTVKCTQEEADKYIEKIKKAGFEINPAEGTNYYSARTADYFSVEITYISGMLTVFCKRV